MILLRFSQLSPANLELLLLQQYNRRAVLCYNAEWEWSRFSFSSDIHFCAHSFWLCVAFTHTVLTIAHKPCSRICLNKTFMLGRQQLLFNLFYSNKKRATGPCHFCHWFSCQCDIYWRRIPGNIWDNCPVGCCCALVGVQCFSVFHGLCCFVWRCISFAV